MGQLELFNASGSAIGEPLSGYRLWSMEVLNWGTFDRQIWSLGLEGHNALLTGDIGSGKSTLVDALTCLLVPYKKITFNKAAGAEGKERDLSSYIKGEFKKEKEETTKIAKKVFIRPDNDTYTVIIGHFKNQGYNETVCLAHIYWIGKDNKVEKLFISSSTLLTVSRHFNGFADVNELRKNLRKTPGVTLFNDNFTQYSEHFRRLFGMNSEKAIDLFNQTVSMKAVSSLTNFVREQMLERTDIQEEIKSLLKRFEDLKKSHEAVVHAREQHAILKPLVEAAVSYGQVSEQIEQVEKLLQVAPYWFAEKKLQLIITAMEVIEKDLEKLAAKELQHTQREQELETKKEGIVLEIAGNGGKRIEQIGQQIKTHEKDKAITRKEYEDYDKLITRAGLRKTESEADFYHNLQRAERDQGACLALKDTLRLERDQAVSLLRRLEGELITEQAELKSLKARRTQIPAWLIQFRTQLCSDLEIDQTDLPFAGELLQVQAAEKDWEGAVERLLHAAAISLLVPSEFYKSVSRYVNDNQLRSIDGRGIKLTYLEADLSNVKSLSQQLDTDSVFYKVDIKPDSLFCDWLEAHIKKNFGDYICTDVDGLAHVAYGLTRQGLIKSGRIRHTKDDRSNVLDRRHFVLGWSNEDKIKLMECSVEDLEQQLTQASEKKSAIESKENKNEDQYNILNNILFLKDYARINWQLHAASIHELEKERDELLYNNDVLARLEESKKEVIAQIEASKSEGRAMVEKRGGLKASYDQYLDESAALRSDLRELTQSEKDEWFAQLDQRLAAVQLNLRGIDKRKEEFIKQYRGDSGELKKLTGRQRGFATHAENKMRDIKTHSPAEYDELSATIENRAEYIKKFEQLTREDLKRHEQRFKTQLNTDVIRSIAVFHNQLLRYEQDIREKIRTINQSLEQIVYNSVQDTYITILMDTTSHKEVRQFKEDLKNCYSNTLGQNSDLYTEEKYEQVKTILDRFASSENIDKEWTLTVTDVRKWYEFNAMERYRQDNADKEFYESSGGKSGGQKEKLAYTILASALAYQFGLNIGEAKSKNFRFVVIDEAFGKGSDESTRYGLELFRKLNLQLLIVTPLQKIHVIDNYVNSFHFISNPDGNNSQVTTLTKQQYLQEKQKREGSADMEETENNKNITETEDLGLAGKAQSDASSGAVPFVGADRQEIEPGYHRLNEG